MVIFGKHFVECYPISLGFLVFVFLSPVLISECLPLLPLPQGWWLSSLWDISRSHRKMTSWLIWYCLDWRRWWQYYADVFLLKLKKNVWWVDFPEYTNVRSVTKTHEPEHQAKNISPPLFFLHSSQSAFLESQHLSPTGFIESRPSQELIGRIIISTGCY